MTPSEAHSPTALPFGATGFVGNVVANRYRIEALLGEGGMGAVYLAEHLLMRKRFALKVLHAEMTRMPEIVARFEREAMAAAHIEHPNVAAATDFGKLEDGTFFLVLEYVEGTSLRDVVAKGPLDVERTLHIAAQIASALARAHGLGIVHRDLKPDNVMLVERDGDPDFVKVLDFGIAKVPMGEVPAENGGSSGQVLTQLGMIYGTPEYMAPEQALGQAVDGRADLYAVGVMMFEMITGVRPFEGPSVVALLGAKVTTDPPSLVSKNPALHVSDEVDALVRVLLDKEAGRRMATAHDLLDAIERCRMDRVHDEPATARRAAGRGRAPGSARHRLPTVPAPTETVETRAEVGVAAATARNAPWVRAAAKVRASSASIVGRLPASMRSMPALVWIGAAALTVLVVIGLALSALGGAKDGVPTAASASAASTPMLRRWLPPPTAPAETLAAAVASGAPALAELATKFPDDPAVWRALVRAYTKDKRGVDAMGAVAKWAALQASALDEDDARDALAAALAGPPESMNAAFTFVEGEAGSHGPELVFDLLTAKSTPPKVAQRMKQSLAKPEMRARMSPSVAVAVDFRNATGCEAKRALLPRLKEVGDDRVLPTLRAMQTPKGCGFLGLADCWGCMRRDGALAAALAAVEERSPK